MYFIKFSKKVLTIFLVICITFTISSKQLYASIIDDNNEFRAMWVGTVFGLNYPSKATTNEKVLKEDAIKILNYVEDMGFNTIIFQVRPSSDALYKSNIFPWSKHLTGTQGVAPENNFDPLSFFIEQGHKRNIAIHAWINPYRVTASKTDNSKLSKNNPAVINKNLTFTHTDGKIYWNPGEPESRNIIVSGIKEIIDNYDVDGIHIDDYFYPNGKINDKSTYEKYGQGFENIDNWRRDNVNQLVKSIYDTIHNKDNKIVFGVSPSGIWANKTSQSTLGSETNGSESYYDNFADSRTWVKKGYIDYIIPQIYWNIGYEKADYAKLTSWWSDVVKDTNVKLYIGQAAYKTGNKDISSPWYGINEIKQQIYLNRINDVIGGYAMYSYSIFNENPDLYNLMKEINN